MSLCCVPERLPTIPSRVWHVSARVVNHVPRPSGAVKKTYCRVGARERQAHAKLSAPKRRPCRNRNFCASTPD